MMIGLEHHCAQVRTKVILKERVLAKRERSRLRSSVLLKERKQRELAKKYFPGPATLPESWREKKPDELIMSGTIDENPGRATMVFKQGPNGIPIFRDAPIRRNRVLENKAGDPRLWDPSDTEFWSVCQHAIPAEDAPTSYLVLSPG